MEKTNDLTIVRNGGMTSLEIAEVTGKAHRGVMMDIRNLLDQGVQQHNFVLSSYRQTLPNGATRMCPATTLRPKAVLFSHPATTHY